MGCPCIRTGALAGYNHIVQIDLGRSAPHALHGHPVKVDRVIHPIACMRWQADGASN